MPKLAVTPVVTVFKAPSDLLFSPHRADNRRVSEFFDNETVAHTGHPGRQHLAARESGLRKSGVAAEGMGRCGAGRENSERRRRSPVIVPGDDFVNGSQIIRAHRRIGLRKTHLGRWDSNQSGQAKNGRRIGNWPWARRRPTAGGNPVARPTPGTLQCQTAVDHGGSEANGDDSSVLSKAVSAPGCKPQQRVQRPATGG